MRTKDLFKKQNEHLGSSNKPTSESIMPTTDSPVNARIVSLKPSKALSQTDFNIENAEEQHKHKLLTATYSEFAYA